MYKATFSLRGTTYRCKWNSKGDGSVAIIKGVQPAIEQAIIEYKFWDGPEFCDIHHTHESLARLDKVISSPDAVVTQEPMIG